MSYLDQLGHVMEALYPERNVGTRAGRADLA